MHIKEGQLEISNKEGIVFILIEDISLIMTHGANVCLSAADISILSQNKVAMLTLDEKYLPTTILLPFEGHARRSKLMHAQVETTDGIYRRLWFRTVKFKISDQSRNLSILGLEDAGHGRCGDGSGHPRKGREFLNG